MMTIRRESTLWLSCALLLLSAACGDGTTAPDGTAPTLSISSPAEGATVEADSIQVRGTASDDRGVSQVLYRLGGGAEQQVTITAGKSIDWSFTVRGLVPGEQEVTVVAVDAAGNRTELKRTITYDPPAFTVRVAEPRADGGTFGRALNRDGVVVGQHIGGVGQAFVWTPTGMTLLPNPAGGSGAVGLDVNGAGTVVGSVLVSGTLRAVRWSGGTPELLAPDVSVAWAIGDEGTIVGGESIEFVWQPIMWEGGQRTIIPGFEQHHGQARAMSGSGRIAGITGVDAFVWHDGAGQVLPRLDGSPESRPWAIDDAGQVVGGAAYPGTNAGGDLPVIWNGGSVSQLPMRPGAQFGVARGINGAGVIVGISFAHGNSEGVIWCGDQVFSIDELVGDPAWHFESAYAINESGQITGAARATSGGYPRAYLLTPVDLPQECDG